MSIPISTGSGAASVAAEAVGGLQYQQIEMLGKGGASVLAINPDGSFNASIIGSPKVTVSSLISVPGTVSTVNSSTSTLGGGAVFTGTSEDVKDFGSITVSVFTDQVSASDGLSIQQSSNGTNWDLTDTYTIAASTGKTFSVQPSARFFRIVYTNGATPQGAFRLQTVYHTITTKASSQRSSDNYTNETDLEQNWAFDSFYNDATTSWDRMRGNATNGMKVWTGNTSVLSQSVGSVITIIQNASVAGTYAEDSPHTTGDRGLFVFGVRNDTLSSITSNDGDYSPFAVGPTGAITTNDAPITKWIQGTADLRVVLGASVTAIAAQGASIFTYIREIQVANMGSASVLVTFSGGLGSILGYTIAPAGGGSNFITRLKTGENSAFTASISGVASVLVSAQGFISKS